ncbi:L-ectoine synthase [Kroppenstedtia guangzhouensis]|jgi:L-ectoine synthase|uniref:L-ectoine synthase n=1 Tax=Kroppenstedtia guangzhouensis TaxID=1274356 RepID=A0ABQ1G6K8_9BACL|nr:ectoine synthase [Kroppenstedtia guangzhouensis]GGA37741.1 L-ectoine synthase [Kroppenstedtia guangzhouensis]
MIVKHLEDLIGTEDEVKGETWISRRLLLKKDGVGFSLHDTLIRAGTVSQFWYKHHIEAVYCIEGEGQLTNLENGDVHPLKPGTLYTLNGHEKHRVRAVTDLRMVCVFNPPCTGQETHDEEGAYPLLD